jgi:hypothetical protein
VAAPRIWTPVFFLDDAVALAAGHRPCGLCRHDCYLAYRDGVVAGRGMVVPPSAADLNRMLAAERLGRGRGLSRAGDRILWEADITGLPDGAVIIHQGQACLVSGDRLRPFGFGGWGEGLGRPRRGEALVLTPPTSVTAMAGGFTPWLHPSAQTP